MPESLTAESPSKPLSESLIQVIVNPTSGGGVGRSLRLRVEEWLGKRSIPFRTWATDAPGHARELAEQASRDGIETILAVGGDGTIHEVANGILAVESASPVLGIVPVGTGNDFYRMVGPSRKLDEALGVVEAGEIRTFDVGLARWGNEQEYFVNLMGVGIDVEVLRRRARFKRLRGLAQYLAALLPAVVGYRAVPLAIQVDGRELTGPTMLCAATVGPSIGGGFFLSPGAQPNDGLLDLCFIRSLGFFEVLRYIPRVLKGTHGSLPKVDLAQFSEAKLSRTDGEVFHFELDGELVADPVRSVAVEVLRGRLRVFTKRS